MSIEKATKALIQYFETNEEKFFQVFYEDMYQTAFQTAYYISGNSADAEDISQQAFLILYKKVETCEAIINQDDKQIRSWFLSIVYNQARMFVRTKIRRSKREKQHFEEKENNMQCDDANEKELHLKDLKDALEALPEKYRTPLLLKYKNGFDNNEISNILTMNQSTLRNRLSRGLQKLKALLTGDNSLEKILPSIAICGYLALPKKIVPPTFSSAAHLSTRMVAAKPSSIWSIKTKLMAALFTAIVPVSAYLFISSNPNNENAVGSAQVKVVSPITEQTNQSIDWSFTQGNLNEFKVITGEWEYIEGYRFPKGKDKTVIQLPIKPTGSFELLVEGGIFTKDLKGLVSYGVYPGYSLEKQLFFEPSLFLAIEKFKSTKQRAKVLTNYAILPKTQKLVFTDEYLLVVYQEKIYQIFPGLKHSSKAKPSFYHESMCTESIKYNPISDQEALAYIQKAKDILYANTKKK